MLSMKKGYKKTPIRENTRMVSYEKWPHWSVIFRYDFLKLFRRKTSATSGRHEKAAALNLISKPPLSYVIYGSMTTPPLEQRFFISVGARLYFGELKLNGCFDITCAGNVDHFKIANVQYNKAS